MSGIGWLDGVFAPLEELRVSPLDRGFLFADGVYEVVPVYAGKLFRCEAHLARLERSLAGVRIPEPLPRAEWVQVLDELVTRNGGGDQAVYLQVTRGVAPRDHAFPQSTTPTAFAMTRAVQRPAEPPPRSAITRPDPRWQRCDIKSVSLLPNVLLRQEAREAGVDEAILLRDGQVTEGAATNVFIVKDDFIVTPPKTNHLLGGVTRDLLVELLEGANLPLVEGPIEAADLEQATEVWITSSSMEVAPVVNLDGQPVGAGKPGPVWQRARRLFSDYVAAG